MDLLNKYGFNEVQIRTIEKWKLEV
jgi:hypothetical protein